MNEQEVEQMVATFLAYAADMDRLAEDFDDSGKKCECCEAFRYANFTEKQIKDRVVGVGIRMREIADTIERKMLPEVAEKIR